MNNMIPKNKKYILCTGALGFIGSNFVNMILDETDYEVVILDAHTYAANPENVLGTKNPPIIYNGFIDDENLLDDIFEKYNPSLIVNFAAESHVDNSINTPAMFVDNNTYQTAVLLDYCRKKGVKRFLQVSTDEVYGDSSEVGKFKETMKLNPSSPYSASKAGADLIVLSYHRTFGMDVVVTRCSNNYGPYQHPEKLIPKIISNAIEGKEIPLYGDGQQKRDWIYVEDHCRGILLALEKGKSGEIYNFGGMFAPITNLSLTERILNYLESKSIIELVKDRPGHDKEYDIDYSKAKKKLGWEPKVSLGDGLVQTIEWYKNNQEWINKMKGNKK